VIPNDDLRKADEEDRAIDALDQYGKELFYEGLIEELLELTVVSIGAIAAAVKKYRGPLGRIKAEVEELLGRRNQSTSQGPTQPEPATTSTSESPTGSISSPAATDGPEERSSSESDGASSLASASA
jgi:hypothetical protein